MSRTWPVSADCSGGITGYLHEQDYSYHFDTSPLYPLGSRIISGTHT